MARFSYLSNRYTKNNLFSTSLLRNVALEWFFSNVAVSMVYMYNVYTNKLEGGMMLIRKQIYLSKDVNRRLAEVSSEKGISQSEIIREGVEMYLSKVEESQERWDKLLQQMRDSDKKQLKWNREEVYRDRTRQRSEDHERID